MEKTPSSGKSLIRRRRGDKVGVGAYLRLNGRGWGESERLFEAGA